MSAPEFHDKELVIKALLADREALVEELERAQIRSHPDHSKGLGGCLAAIATNAWKAKAKMIDATTGEPREEMRRVYRHIESIFDAFQQIGLELKDHTGDAFDYGLPLNVITTQPTPGIEKERVIETIKPTIYWNDLILQEGEVVIATPVHR